MKIVFVPLCLLLLVSSVQSQTSYRPVSEQQKISDYLISRNKLVPLNASVLVAKGNDIIAQHYFGYGDAQKKAAIDSATLFPIASATKPFTATAIMMLQEKGKLSIQDPITKLLKGFPSSWDKVQIKHLLSHTSGIPEFFKLIGSNKVQANLASLTQLYKKVTLEFVPGEKFSYANINYILLSYLIEQVAGISYEAFMQKNVFSTLGMKQTGFVYNYKGNSLAKPYVDAVQMNLIPIAERETNFAVLKGAGGMYSTSLDLLKFLSGMQKLISKKTLELMQTPVKEDYGLGWTIQPQFKKTTTKHSGFLNGFTCEMRFIIEDSTSLIVLSNIRSNSLNIRYTCFDVTKILNNQEPGYTGYINPSYLGKYSLPKEFADRFKAKNIEITLLEGKFQLSIPNVTTRYLLPVTNDKFFFYGESVDVVFEPSGKEVKIFSQSLGEIVCKKQ